jgi:hypothetical protein
MVPAACLLSATSLGPSQDTELIDIAPAACASIAPANRAKILVLLIPLILSLLSQKCLGQAIIFSKTEKLS